MPLSDSPATAVPTVAALFAGLTAGWYGLATRGEWTADRFQWSDRLGEVVAELLSRGLPVAKLVGMIATAAKAADPVADRMAAVTAA